MTHLKQKKYLPEKFVTNITLKWFFIVVDHFVAHEVAPHVKFFVAHVADVIVALSVGFPVVPHAVSVGKSGTTNTAGESSAAIFSWLLFVCVCFHVVGKRRLQYNITLLTEL